LQPNYYKINEYRDSLGLQKLKPNELINDVSYRNPQRMLSSGFNHNTGQ
jgi:uncharacterized protein YkwD